MSYALKTFPSMPDSARALARARKGGGGDEIKGARVGETPQDFRFVHAVQLVMERWLEDVHVKYTLSQRDRAGMRCDEFANERFPCAEDFGFLHPFL